MPRVKWEERDSATAGTGVAHDVTLPEASRVWAKVAANSFGGPAGQIAVMHRFLVEEHRWISERRFLHALNFCMFLPGPEAQQLATYIGWLMHGTRGGLIAGLLFILPGVVAILALSLIYVLVGDVEFVSGLLFGLQAAVVAIVAEAVLRIGRRAGRTRAQQAIAAAAFIAIFFFAVPFPLIVVAAGLFGWFLGRVLPQPAAPAAESEDSDALLGDLGETPDRAATRSAARAAVVAVTVWLVPVGVLVAVLGTGHVFAQEAVFFSTSAMVTFGGAYAVLSYLTQAAVDTYGWLSPGEMLTGLGMAETTPGPLIMVVQFVGFMGAYRNPGSLSPITAALLGSLVATWVTFAPCFFFIFAGAPFIERLRGNASLSNALSAITAAVVGVILNLAVWFAIHTVFAEVDTRRTSGLQLLVPNLGTVDVYAVAIIVVSMLLIFRFKVSVMRTLAISAVLGLMAALLR